MWAASPQMNTRRSRNLSATSLLPNQSSLVSTSYSKSGPTPRIARMAQSRSIESKSASASRR